MKQFSRFVVVGVVNTLLGYCVIFSCMYLVGMNPEISNISGYGVGLVISYVLHKKYTFKKVQSRRGEFIRFITVFLIAFAANFLILVILIHEVEAHEGLSQILAGIVYVAIAYLMSKFYVFKSASPVKVR